MGGNLIMKMTLRAPGFNCTPNTFLNEPL